MRPRIRVWRSKPTGPGYVWLVSLPDGIYAHTGWRSAINLALSASTSPEEGK